MVERRRRTTAVVPIEKEPYASPFVLALAVIRGPDLKSIHRITQDETLVGRSEEAHFELSDTLISDKHFLIRVRGNLYSLYDLGSTNGTLLNGQVVSAKTPVRLKNLDEIEMGRTRLLFIAARFHTEPTNP